MGAGSGYAGRRVRPGRLECAAQEGGQFASVANLHPADLANRSDEPRLVEREPAVHAAAASRGATVVQHMVVQHG